MKHQIHKTNNTVLFSKWTRKNYAVFASLKKVVNIVRLSIQTCFALLGNNKVALRLLNKGENIEFSNSEPDEDQMVFSQYFIILLLNLGVISLDESCSLTNRKYNLLKVHILRKAEYGLFFIK
jgi:hypothetical protein